jgi:cytochrome c oxidase assembly protein subunit 15
VKRNISPRSYEKLCLASYISLFAIVVSGGLVRLTGSGLGCSDWPQCNSEKFIDVSSMHGAIEQINRLFTGVVAALVIAAVLGSLFLAERKKSLTQLSLGLVVGVLGQVILGGIVVLTGLNPFANMGHFLLSMVLIANAVVLYRHSREGRNPVSDCSSLERKYLAGIGVLFALAVISGTVVTATGPHAGDETAVRFGFSISSVARIHGFFVLLSLLALLIVLLKVKNKSHTREFLEQRLAVFLGVGLLQALVGYVQYFNGIPVVLVATHLFGAALIWSLAVDTITVSGNGLSRPRSQPLSHEQFEPLV